MTPLHTIGNFLRETMLAIPLFAVRALFIASLAIVLIWVLRLPREETTRPGETPRWWENLKVWAALALLIQIAVYSVF